MNPQRIEQKTPGAAHPGKTRLQAMPSEPNTQQSLFASPTGVPSEAGDEAADRMAMRRTDTLKPHPSLLKQNLQPTEERLLALEKSGEAIFEQPLLITKDNLIVDGHARWLIAQRRQRATILCQVCQLTEQEALQRILQTHRRPEWLNPFSRVRLALDLEPWFREKARANQSAGGKEKLSSNLTEDRRLDCRKQIATLAGVSTGNVTKVKQILGSHAATQVMEALRAGEISIHRVCQLSKLSIREQEAALGSRRNKKRSTARIRKLLSQHTSQNDPAYSALRNLSCCITDMKSVSLFSDIWQPIDDLLTAIEHKFPNIRRDADAHQIDPQANPGRQSSPMGSCADTACGPRKLPEGARLPDARTRG
jgi:hypothetical protein